MKNLRISEEKTYVDAFGTGDSILVPKFNICKDFEVDFNYTDELKKRGQIVETLRSRENAELLLEALKKKYE